MEDNNFANVVQKASSISDNNNWSGARSVIVIVVGNEHGDKSSNPGRNWLHFT